MFTVWKLEYCIKRLCVKYFQFTQARKTKAKVRRPKSDTYTSKAMVEWANLKNRQNPQMSDIHNTEWRYFFCFYVNSITSFNNILEKDNCQTVKLLFIYRLRLNVPLLKTPVKRSVPKLLTGSRSLSLCVRLQWRLMRSQTAVLCSTREPRLTRV